MAFGVALLGSRTNNCAVKIKAAQDEILPKKNFRIIIGL